MTTEMRIVEICPDLFEVQQRGLFGWSRTDRQYDHTIAAARERLARLQKSYDWTPKVHDPKPAHRHCFQWNGDFWAGCECGEFPSLEQVAALEAKFAP